MSEKRWMSSGCLQAAPTGEIDEEQGIIRGVSVCTVGEAEGHGVNLDSEFVRTVVQFGQDRKRGLKARFGHPNMCSTALGTFIGRFKNFRKGVTERDGEKAEAAIADLFLSNEAHDAPHGDLFTYVLGMATNEPDMFGTSIVFTPGREYKRTAKGAKIYHPGWSPDGDETGDEYQERRREYSETPGPVYVECANLHACDAVDEPAANEGLFSRFSQETVAGQITEFLDLNPHVWKALNSNPSIIEALARHGEKVDEFMDRYRAYREHSEESAMTDETTSSEKLESAGVEEPAASEAPETKTGEEAAGAETTDENTGAETTDESGDETTDAGDAGAGDSESGDGDGDGAGDGAELSAPSLSREEFSKIADEFGDVIASKVMREGGDYTTALREFAAAQKEENAELRAQIASLGGAGNGTPAKVFTAAAENKKKTKSLFNSKK